MPHKADTTVVYIYYIDNIYLIFTTCLIKACCKLFI